MSVCVSNYPSRLHCERDRYTIGECLSVLPYPRKTANPTGAVHAWPTVRSAARARLTRRHMRWN